MFSSLKARITLVSIIISTISLLALASAVYFAERSNLLDTIDKNTSQTSSIYASKLSQWIEGKRELTHSITDMVHDEDPLEKLKLAEKAGLDLAYFVRNDKSHAFTVPRNSNYDGTQRDWYKQAVAAGKSVITPVYEDSSTGNLVVSIVEPVLHNNKIYAVVGSDLELTTVVNEVNSIRPYDKSFAFIFNKETEKIIVHADSSLVLQPISNLSTELNSRLIDDLTKTGEHATISINNEKNMLYAQDIEDTPWVLVVSIDYAEATQSLNKLAYISVFIVLLCIAATSILMMLFVNRQLARLSSIRDALDDIASGDGDLTHRLDESGKDELTQIARSFNQFSDKITDILLQIRTSSEAISTASNEIAVGSQDLASRTEQQASSLAETASTMEEITATVRQNSDNVVQANTLSSNAAKNTDVGREVVSELVATMGEINQKSQQVHDIIDVIDSIAFQTNILALNAAVEAARAGESGRGFAVVASEVRALAQRSASAAHEIKELIESSVQATNKGDQQVESANTAMQEILSSIMHVSDIMGEISSANKEQTVGIEEINSAVTQMDDVTHQNASLVEESAAAARSLQEQASELSELVASFKIDRNDTSAYIQNNSLILSLPERSINA